jgi:signal transduction histidine kinase
MRLTLRTLLLVLLPIIIFSAIITISNNIIFSEILIGHEGREASLLLEFSAVEMVNPMYNLDRDRLNEIIDNLEDHEDVLQVLVLFPDGRVLTDGTDEDYNYGNVLHDDFLNSPNIANEKQVLFTDDLIRLSSPIILGETIGIVTIDFSLESINLQIMETTNIILLATAGLLVVFVIVAIVFSRSITNPIFEIEEKVIEISEGRYTPSQKQFDIPEIQKLNEKIDEMYEKISFFQKELTKTERLATIGELSARIAHDLRNPLTTIKNSVELLKIKNPELIKKNTEYFDFIDLSIDKINSEISGVLNHTKVRPLQKSDNQFLDMINHSLSSLEMPENIKVVMPKNNPTIFCDGEQLENVFSNLIGNSIDAIGKNSGEITINLDENQKEYTISVSDSGQGISKKNMETIFEPLFTTKQYGTGLGLVNCKNIIESHNGTIVAKNNPTTFTIKLPKS